MLLLLDMSIVTFNFFLFSRSSRAACVVEAHDMCPNLDNSFGRSLCWSYIEFPCRLLPTRFQKIVGKSCSHILKHKLSSNHKLVVRQNVKGCGHGPLDFHTSTKESLTYKCQLPKVLKTGYRSRRRLVGGLGFEKMGVAQLARTNPTPLDPLYIWVGLSFLFALEYGG